MGVLFDGRSVLAQLRLQVKHRGMRQSDEHWVGCDRSRRVPNKPDVHLTAAGLAKVSNAGTDQE
jgi:hypothetical protein